MAEDAAKVAAMQIVVPKTKPAAAETKAEAEQRALIIHQMESAKTITTTEKKHGIV